LGLSLGLSLRTLCINGQTRVVTAPPQARLLDVLQDELAMTDARFGCGANACGACHVLLGDRSVPACDTPLWACEGQPITTARAVPTQLLQAFEAEQAAQCGYCSAGMLVAATALLRKCPQPTDAQVRQALDGHLCRCGAHNRIVCAVLGAAAALQAQQPL
jgi:nicotinate dehydrogenase subunit A